MDPIVRIPPSIRHAHVPGIGDNPAFYADLAQTLEEMSQHLLVDEALLTVIARKVDVRWSELSAAIELIAARSGENPDGIKILLDDVEEFAKALLPRPK